MKNQIKEKTISQQKSKRMVSIDAIKAIACICVICMHTLRNINAEVSYHSVLYYFTRISMPLFFMVSGYLQIGNSKCTMRYCVHKILKIVALCSFWTILFNIFRFLKNGIAINLLDIVQCYFQVGPYSIFWFFGTMIIIYMVLPLFNKLFNNNRFAIFFTSMLAGICVIVHITSVMYASRHNLFLQSYIIQTFRLWSWFFYFSLGGCIKTFKLNEKFTSVKLLFIAVIVFSALANCEQHYLFKILTNVINGEYYYDSPLMMLQAGSIFLLMMNIKYSTVVEKVVMFLAFNLIGSYVFHIRIIKELSPHLGFLGFWGEYAAILFIVLFTFLLSSIVNKIPYINRMLRI